MSYIEATVIVDGAIDGGMSFTDADTFDEWLAREKSEAMWHPLQKTDIYLMEHGHSEDVQDCTCAQYLTDHHPFWSFGGTS